MTEECGHVGQGHWCLFNKLSVEEKQTIKDHVNKMTDEERLQYLGTCRVIKPCLALNNNAKQFAVEYYLKNFGTPELRVCRTSFMQFYSKTGSVLDRENRSILREGIIMDRRRNNRPSINQYGLPLTEGEWRQLEDWINNKVPRKRSKNNWIVCNEEEYYYTHKELLAQYNEEAQRIGGRQFTLENWKKCWYNRLHLKGKWQFKRRVSEKEQEPPAPPTPSNDHVSFFE